MRRGVECEPSRLLHQTPTAPSPALGWFARAVRYAVAAWTVLCLAHPAALARFGSSPTPHCHHVARMLWFQFGRGCRQTKVMACIHGEAGGGGRGLAQCAQKTHCRLSVCRYAPAGNASLGWLGERR